MYNVHSVAHSTYLAQILSRRAGGGCWAQSRQSAKRFSSRWNWDSPTPLAAGECAPPPFGPGGRAHSLAAKGVGESQFQRRDRHCGALYIYKYFVSAPLLSSCSNFDDDISIVSSPRSYFIQRFIPILWMFTFF